MQDFLPEFRALCGPIVASSVEAYNRISAELLPTPAKSHYTFNLRDLAKVFQVILLVKYYAPFLHAMILDCQPVVSCHEYDKDDLR